MPENSREIYQFGAFRLDVGERALVRRDDDTRVALPEKAFLALVQLVRRAGMLVTREELLGAVWPHVFVEDGNVAKVIHTIRCTLGDSDENTYVETVPKHGYRFVADVLRVRSRIDGGGAVSSPTRKQLCPGSPEYDLFMRGKVKACAENIDDVNEAIALLEAAVGLAADCADGYAQLARAYNTRAFKFSSQIEAKRLSGEADIALAKALDLDPNLAEVHFIRGLLLWTKAKGFPHEQAIAAFTRALALDPESDETHHQLSMVYSHVGLLDDAERHVARAIDLNPNNTMARFRAGVYAAWQCRFEDALAVLQTVPLDVSRLLVDRVRAEVYIQLGRLDKARAIVDDYLAAHPSDEGGSLTSVRALLLAKAGERRGAKRAIVRAIEIGSDFGHFHHTAYNIAGASAALGELDEAVKWVEAAAEDGFPCYSLFARDPNLRPLRQFPRFADVMSQLRERAKRLVEATHSTRPA